MPAVAEARNRCVDFFKRYNALALPAGPAVKKFCLFCPSRTTYSTVKARENGGDETRNHADD